MIALLFAMASATTLDRVAAVVNEEVISLSEVYEVGGAFIPERCPQKAAECVQNAELEILDSLVRTQLMIEELQRLGYDVTKDEIDGTINNLLRQYNLPSREALRAEVERSGLTWQSYLDQMEMGMRIERFQQQVLRSRIHVSDDEVRDAWMRSNRDYKAPLVATLDGAAYRIPTNATEDEAREAIDRMRADLDRVRAGEMLFDDFVMAWDTSNLRGVFAGQTFRQGDLHDDLGAAIFAGQEGEYVGPVRSGGVMYIFHLLKMDRADGDPPSLEASKERILNTIYQEKVAQVEQEWYGVARRQAAIQIFIGDES